MKHWGYVGTRSGAAWTIVLVGVLENRQRVSYRRQNRPLSHSVKNQKSPPSFDKDASFRDKKKLTGFLWYGSPIWFRKSKARNHSPCSPCPIWNSAEYYILQTIRCNNISEGKLRGGAFPHMKNLSTTGRRWILYRIFQGKAVHIVIPIVH